MSALVNLINFSEISAECVSIKYLEFGHVFMSAEVETMISAVALKGKAQQ